MISKSRPRPLFLVVEGIDGAGKTWLVSSLVAHFGATGRPVKASREPSDGPHGRRLRECMMTGRLPPQEELDLFIEDRKDHIKNTIRPNLGMGVNVVLDRYFYSTVAYQGAGGLHRPADIEALMSFAPVPDVTLLLDLSPEQALQRLRADRLDGTSEYETLEMLTACRSIFLEMADRRREISILDATLNPDELLSAALTLIVEYEAAQERLQENYEKRAENRPDKVEQGSV